jgi:hypothetical protein
MTTDSNRMVQCHVHEQTGNSLSSYKTAMCQRLTEMELINKQQQQQKVKNWQPRAASRALLGRCASLPRADVTHKVKSIIKQITSAKACVELTLPPPTAATNRIQWRHHDTKYMSHRRNAKRARSLNQHINITHRTNKNSLLFFETSSSA